MRPSLLERHAHSDPVLSAILASGHLQVRAISIREKHRCGAAGKGKEKSKKDTRIMLMHLSPERVARVDGMLHIA